MRRIGIKSLLTIMAVSLVMVSCGKKDYGASRTTGWNYNDPENGGFTVNEIPEQVTGPGLVVIEGGTFTMGATMENVYYEWNNTPRQVTVSSFYMDQTEVSNLDYLEYVYWLNRVFGKDCPERVTKALPDTTVWRNLLSYNEPMVELYFRHPAYRDYPVVGVTWLQANDYALWRSDRVNEKLRTEQHRVHRDGLGCFDAEHTEEDKDIGYDHQHISQRESEHRDEILPQVALSGAVATYLRYGVLEEDIDSHRHDHNAARHPHKQSLKRQYFFFLISIAGAFR